MQWQLENTVGRPLTFRRYATWPQTSVTRQYTPASSTLRTPLSGPRAVILERTGLRRIGRLSRCASWLWEPEAPGTAWSQPAPREW